MKKKTLRQALSALLAIVLLLSAAPVAYGAWTCPKCGGTSYITAVVTEANCHEPGVVRYTCTRTNCGGSTLEATGLDSYKHDAVCTDNGDGLTHTATCPYHPNAYSKVKEKHTFVDGRCTKCLAVDYNGVAITVPKEQVVYVELGESSASISVGDVAITVGGVDVSEYYAITYNWYLNSAPVGSGKTYTLPASSTRQEAEYSYVCFIMATPKNSLASKPINNSCTVTVRVRDLIHVNASLNSDSTYFTLGGTNSATPVSVQDQIYAALVEAGSPVPGYVQFDTLPTSQVGSLSAAAGQRYTFLASDANSLSRVTFTPARGNGGTYVAYFTAGDNQGKTCYGVLTLTVGQSLRGMDLVFSTSKGVPAELDAQKFSGFWSRAYPGGTLQSVSFKTLPGTGCGTLNHGYVNASYPGSTVSAGDIFYTAPASGQAGLTLTYVPGGTFTGYTAVSFTAVGTGANGASAYRDGTMYLFVSDTAVSDVVLSVSQGSVANLGEANFRAVYQTVTGRKDNGFYIQLLETPLSGSVYVGNTGTVRDALLTVDNLSSYPLYAMEAAGSYRLENASYISTAAASETVRYAAFSTQGQLLYVGKLIFSRSNLTVTYSASGAAGASGVHFQSADFEAILGGVSAGTYLTFTPPTSGTLTYGKTGTAVTASSKYYLGNDLLSVNNLLYTPKPGMTGTVSIPFTVHFATGDTVSGTVKINVSTAYTIKYKDVKADDWFYTYAMDLAQAGIMTGTSTSAGTFSPQDAVKYGEALKLILLAAGYPAQEKTGEHWASGYLEFAHKNKLMSESVTEAKLEQKISRNAIAELAVRALKLTPSTATTSPYADFSASDAYAPYVLALYEAGIMRGESRSDGTRVFYGTYAIKREEMAKVVWTMYRYDR